MTDHPEQINRNRKNHMNGHGNVIPFADDDLTDREIARIREKLNRELTPRMRKWAIALEQIERGVWPLDPEYTLLDDALDVVLAIRNDCISVNWMSLQLLPEAERERELDRMVKSPKLRAWLELYKENIAKAEEVKRQWAAKQREAVVS